MPQQPQHPLTSALSHQRLLDAIEDQLHADPPSPLSVLCPHCRTGSGTDCPTPTPHPDRVLRARAVGVYTRVFHFLQAEEDRLFQARADDVDDAQFAASTWFEDEPVDFTWPSPDPDDVCVSQAGAAHCGLRANHDGPHRAPHSDPELPWVHVCWRNTYTPAASPDQHPFPTGANVGDQVYASNGSFYVYTGEDWVLVPNSPLTSSPTPPVSFPTVQTRSSSTFKKLASHFTNSGHTHLPKDETITDDSDSRHSRS